MAYGLDLLLLLVVDSYGFAAERLEEIGRMVGWGQYLRLPVVVKTKVRKFRVCPAT